MNNIDNNHPFKGRSSSRSHYFGKYYPMPLLFCCRLLVLLQLVRCLVRGEDFSAESTAPHSIYPQHPSMLLEASLAAGTINNHDHSVFQNNDGEQKRNFVSATLGSNMVLQRGRPVMLWGFADAPGVRIVVGAKNLGLDETKVFMTKASEDPSEHGIWRLELPPQPATNTKTSKPTSFNIASASGQNAELTNILFGDVYLCGGQSNMAFSIPATTNATEEAEQADHDRYSHIRLFTVGQGTSSDDVLLDDLQTIAQPWTVASPQSLMGPSGFSWFSSVCWFFGKEISDGLASDPQKPKIPIGLISNNWGGTSVKLWVPGGKLYNAMIHPYLKGPMAVSGFAWYQGEKDTRSKESAQDYVIDFAYLIQSWKEQFACEPMNHQCYFGFIQLSTWCTGENTEAIPWMRWAQMEVLKNSDGTDKPNIGYATNADYGAGCNIHPPSKQYCGKRLGRSALALHYGQSKIHWKSPSYHEAGPVTIKKKVRTMTHTTATVNTVEIKVALLLKDVASPDGLYLLDEPYNLMNGTFDCSQQVPGTCAYPQILLNNDHYGWVNATIEISPKKPSEIVFRAVVEEEKEQINIRNGDFEQQPKDQQRGLRVSTNLTALATSYGWGGVPMMTLYDAQTNLPVLPWKELL